LRQIKEFSLSSKSIPDFWCSLRNIKDGLDNSNFGILPNFMTKLSIFPHSSASVEITFSLVIHIKTKTDSLKKTLLKKACWQNKDCRNAGKPL